jgi:hypothetical protein
MTSLMQIAKTGGHRKEKKKKQKKGTWETGFLIVMFSAGATEFDFGMHHAHVPC